MNSDAAVETRPAARAPGLAATRPSFSSNRQGADRLCLLFGFKASIDGRFVVMPSNVERVLAFLAIRKQPQRRLHVAAMLWMDSPQDRASANLRTALWKARTVLGDWIVPRGGYLSLAPFVSVDLTRAIELARWLVNDDTDLLPQDGHAAELAGDLLPDWDEEWVLFERERLRQLRIHALESLCRRLSLAGRPAEAIDVGLAAVEAEPLRESAHREVIAAHLREGNICEARRQYVVCRDLLWDAFGSEPSRSMRAIISLSMGET